jgi:hypothetical protein
MVRKTCSRRSWAINSEPLLPVKIFKTGFCVSFFFFSEAGQRIFWQLMRCFAIIDFGSTRESIVFPKTRSFRSGATELKDYSIVNVLNAQLTFQPR